MRTTNRIELLALLCLLFVACKGEECVCDDDTAADDDVTDPDDADGDGFTATEGDCDDADPSVHPDADEGCDDDLDSDCDGHDSAGCTVEIEAGDAVIGSDEVSQRNPGMAIAYWDERPEHEVHVSAYRIDLYEVTNHKYRRCAAAGACSEPQVTASATRPDYYSADEYAGYPVLGVTWEQAVDCCEWRGGRLPTEAEWEKAARGPSPNNQTAPWGELVEIDDWYAHCDKGNYGLCMEDTTEVGKYDTGVSHYGLYDTTGNVAEWTQDWYLAQYYTETPDTDPIGPDEGRFRSIRGGSWVQGWFDGRVVRRKYAEPDLANHVIGFRCAFDVE